jgi:hypothetical protein
VPRVRSLESGTSGSERVLPGTAGVAGTAGALKTAGLATAAGLSAVTVLSAVGLEVSARASEGDVRGRARAAAHVTAIEEARYPRMPTIVDIAILICPSGT